jgi:osmoprotectant transport system substrate-binding protein
MRRSRSIVLGAVLAAFLLAAACAGPGEDEGTTPAAPDEAKGEVTVGSDSFAEAQIVGEMYAQVLENAGYTVTRQLNLESREVRLPAMREGEVEIAPEYLHTLLTVLDEKNPGVTDPDIAGDPEAVKDELEPILQ